jgi:hypothetical protein
VLISEKGTEQEADGEYVLISEKGTEQEEAQEPDLEPFIKELPAAPASEGKP